jgi:uncharacterized protein YbjT (DUF2867 family)
MKVLAIGGAGHVGSEVVKELLKRDAEVDVLVRKEGTKVSEGANAVVGDLLDPAFLEKALNGIDKLYLLNAVTPDELTQALIVYDLAKRLKVKHIVYHSVFRVDNFKDVLMVATLVSTGGLTGLIVKVFHSKKSAKVLCIEESHSKEK